MTIRPWLLISAAFIAVTTSHHAGAQSRGAAVPNVARTCPPDPSGAREAYHLPATDAVDDDVTFATDWTRNRTGGWYGMQVLDDCRMAPDGFLTWHGKPAVRVEVQPGDDPLDSKANSERAEMLIMQDRAGKPITESVDSGVQYYATSYYFPATWRGQQLPWHAFAPMDCTAGNSDRCNSWSTVWQFSGFAALSAAQTTLHGPQVYRVNGRTFKDGGRIRLGKWTDLVFRVDWAHGDYTVWRRDEGEAAFAEVLTGQAAVPAESIAKQGLSRGGAVNGRTDVLWIGPTARGNTFAAVEQAAFGTGHDDRIALSPR